MTRFERTTKELRNQNIFYWKTEYRNPHAGKNIDLFHIIDLIALDDGILGIQVCGSDFKAHVEKIMHEHKGYTTAWLRNGGKLQIWGWRKIKKKRGGKAMVWKPRIADVLLVGNELYLEEQ